MVLVTMLTPTGMKAQNAYLHFWNSSTSTSTNVTMAGWTGSGWTQVISGASLASYVDGSNHVMVLPYIDYSGTHYYKSATAELVNGTTYIMTKDSGTDSYITVPTNYEDYDFTFVITNYSTSGNTLNFKVSWAERIVYQISMDGGSTWKTVTSGSTIFDSSFPFILRKVTGTDTYTYYNGSTLVPGTETAYSSADDAASATPFTSSVSSLYGYTISFSSTGVTLTNLSDGNTYYLVSPELTNNELRNEFKLAPSRARNGGALSTTLYTLNLKQDRLKALLDQYNTINGTSLTSVHYHIVKTNSSGSIDTYYYSYTADYALAASGTLKTTNNNVKWESYNINASSGANNFALASGSGVSYTWLFDASGSGTLELDINLNSLVENAEKSYYVVSNFADATASVNIYPYEATSRAKMTRMVFYKDFPGVGKLSMEAYDSNTMDSVVYRVTVPKPDKGWGELYMAVADSSQVVGSTSGNWSGSGSRWNDVIRPQVQDYGTGTTGMDGTALEGGLFWGNAASQKSQALNPQLTSAYVDATSYTFQMNITTSTYRIIFNEEPMYIMGPAVKPATNPADGDGWGEDETDNAVKLTWVDEDQCFKNMVDGVETPIVMQTGKAFRFAYGKKFTNVWFGENGVIPADLSTSAKAYTAPEGGYDTQYVNYLNTYQSAAGTALDAEKHCTFNLPQKSSGEGYIIRLYMKKIGDEAKYFYTINRRFTFTAPSLADDKKLSDGTTTYEAYRSFSEWHACKLPEGVSMFLVSATDATAKTATLKKLDLDYIPARTGVILATADTKGKFDFETYATDPEATLPSGNDNLLVAQMDNVAIPYSVDVDGTKKYNYIFYALPNNSGVTELGFYHPADGFKSGRNFSYLQIADDVKGGSTSSGAKAFRFVMDMGETTAVHAVETSRAVTDDAYYILQGTRVERPAGKGIYIHNGKKIIIN